MSVAKSFAQLFAWAFDERRRFVPPAPAPSAAVIVLTSLAPANTVTSVEVRSMNGSSPSIMLLRIGRPYRTARSANERLMTVLGIPRLNTVTV